MPLAELHRLAHRADAEPLFRRDDGGEPGDSTGAHITVMVRTDVYAGAMALPLARVRLPTSNFNSDKYLQGIVNNVVMRFADERPPRMPKCADVVLGAASK